MPRVRDRRQRTRTVRASRCVVLLALVFTAAGSGCGASDEREAGPDARDEIVAVVDAANASFAEGDYRVTCSLYTERVRRQLVRDLNARDCVDVWRMTASALADTLTEAQVDGLTSYGIDATSVRITGATAEARFRPPPAALRGVVDRVPRAVSFRRVGGEWKIDSVPS
jgi:hypothetical protein